MAPPLTVIGAATSAGSHHAGQEHAPAALRAAGFVTRLTGAGLDLTDLGDVVTATFAPDAVTATARNLFQRCPGRHGRRPPARPGRQRAGPPRPGLPDAPRPAARRVRLRRDGPRLQPGRLGPRAPRSGAFFRPEVRADPAGFAGRALAALTAASDGIVVHFDVDTIDSRDLPLANFPHYNLGVPLATAGQVLPEFYRAPALRAAAFTEVNPSYDPSGTSPARYVDTVAGALARALTSRP